MLRQLHFESDGFREQIQRLQELEDERRLTRIFSSGDRVFAVKQGVDGRLVAALIARLSRASQLDPRRLYLDEFAGSEELSALMSSSSDLDQTGIAKAEKKIRGYIDAYGDDSVREQANAVMFMRGVSVWTAMTEFTHPLMTRIEASTRYIDFRERDKKRGRYLYAEPVSLPDEDATVYHEVMEGLFETYVGLWNRVWEFVVAHNPRPEGVSESAYQTAVLGRVCDDLRGLLPMGLLTTFGLNGNLRAYSEMAINLAASDNPEARELAREAVKELEQVGMGVFVGVVGSKHGQAGIRFGRLQRHVGENYAATVRGGKELGKRLEVSVRVLNEKIGGDISRALVARHGEKSVMDYPGQLSFVIGELAKLRGNRRHQLDDALRAITVQIEFDGISLGAIKDLFRHRRIDWRGGPAVREVANLVVPDDIDLMGGEIRDAYVSAGREAIELARTLRPISPHDANMVLPHGAVSRYTIQCDLVEAIWIAELRSIASGNEEYRRAAQMLWQQLGLMIPMLDDIKNFVDFNHYELGRAREAARADANRGI